jgi:hypothetical protein
MARSALPAKLGAEIPQLWVEVTNLGHRGTGGLLTGDDWEGVGYNFAMTNKLWSAQELEALTPNERQRVVEEGIVTDLALLPPSLVARILVKGEKVLRDRGVLDTAS